MIKFPRRHYVGASGVVAIVLLTSALAITLNSPAVKAEERQVKQLDLTVGASLEYEIEMQKDTLVWPATTRLGPGSGMYFFAGEPSLHLLPQLHLSGNDQVSISGTYGLTARVFASDKGNNPLWSESVTLRPPTSFSVTADDELTDSAVTIDVTGLHERAEAIQKELKYVGAEHFLEVTLSIDGVASVEGRTEPVQLSLPVRYKLAPTGVLPPPPTDHTEEMNVESITAQTVIVPRSFYSRAKSAWILWLAGSLVVLSGATVWGFPHLRSLLASREDRQFKEWITPGHAATNGLLHVTVQSLEGLVDLAIDMHRRVIFDAGWNTYFLLDGRIAYVYHVQAHDEAPAIAQQIAQVKVRTLP